MKFDRNYTKASLEEIISLYSALCSHPKFSLTIFTYSEMYEEAESEGMEAGQCGPPLFFFLFLSEGTVVLSGE